MSSDLKAKTVQGFGWSALDNVAKTGITFVVSIVLARLLSPDEYGLIGILTIFIVVFNSIVDSGFTQALIRKKDATDVDYSTVFYVNLVVSVFLMICFFFLARPIAAFFERVELVSLTRAMSVIVVINALALVQRTRMTKIINFKSQTKITFLSTLFGGVVGIVLAYLGFGVMSLVAQQIVTQGMTTILLWVFGRWFPKAVFSKKSLAELWRFSWKLLASSLIDTTWKEIYQVVVGKCYSPATLGLYTRAKQFSQMFSSNMTSVISRVSYPVLSSIQDDKVRLKKGYQRLIRTTMYLSFVFMLGMAATAKSMIWILLGEKWMACVPFLQLICFTGMLYPLHSLNLNMLQVQGRSDLFLRLEIIKKIINCGPLLLGIFVDIYWMLIGSFVTGCIAFYLNSYYSGPALNYSTLSQVRDVLPSFGIGFFMALCVFALNFVSLSPYLLFPIQILLGMIIVVAVSELMKLPEYLEIKNILFSKLSKKR
ncbi:MAG: lipopolysaccharide biosynthesis protein [Fibrobacter sp.]|nr:lipopolysaccharide biosynthesis protein [Fibrobacter sp.]